MNVIYIISQNISTYKFTMKCKLKDNIRNKETYMSVAVLCWT